MICKYFDSVTKGGYIMALNDIIIKIVCSNCGKQHLIDDGGIFNQGGHLTHDLNISLPRGWVFMDVEDKTTILTTVTSLNFCSHKCVSKYFDSNNKG